MKKTRHLGIVFAGAALSALALFIVAPHSAPLAHEADDESYPTTTHRTYNNPNIVQFKYDYTISPDLYSEYNAIIRAMQPDLKGTPADLTLAYPTNPPLNVAEYDLNNDGVEELIAVPIETTEDGNYCGGDYHRCPHYILERQDKNMKVLGVIKAFAIDRGDSIKNGFWTLKVFPDSRLPEFSPQIDIYAFDKKQKIYAKDFQP